MKRVALEDLILLTSRPELLAAIAGRAPEAVADANARHAPLVRALPA